MKNRKSFIWWGEARIMRDVIVPEYATKAEIKKDDEGFWLNVWWKSGIIAPLTVQEESQAMGNQHEPFQE